jgi:KaiC/GvpD/RAD55 family RecA-like ATPase
MMEIKRSELVERLAAMAAYGPVLVVGQPGSGKSWLLGQFSAEREAAGDAVLLLLAEEHNHVQSIAQLNESLNVPAGLIATLKAYEGQAKFFIIDSLDALRAESSQRVFRKLIRQVREELPDWVVIASIRSFDAAESPELQQLFSSTSKVWSPPRLFEVPLFSNSEIGEAAVQIPKLRQVLSSASPQVLDLLRNAFNLWIVVRLLYENANLDWLYSLESEVQLFERYWKYRIEARPDAADRLWILHKVTQTMVASRTLSAAFEEVYSHPGAAQAFHSLFSDEILRRTPTNRMAYTHNILFDFSLAKLLLDEEKLFSFLAAPTSVLFRPSISYFLGLLWHRSRPSFWAIVKRFFVIDSAPLPARLLVLPGMAVFSMARTAEDLQPLFDLEGDIAPQAILSVLRSIAAFDGLSSQRGPLWLSFICGLSRQIDARFFNEYLALLEAAADKTNWVPELSSELARSACRFLEWTWAESAKLSDGQASQLLSIAASRLIPLISRLYPHDPTTSLATLRKVLDRIGTAGYSPNEAYWLASSLEQLINFDPSFAVDVYERIFSHSEHSKEATQLGGGTVLVLTSTKSQDYSMAYYILGVRYPQLVTRDISSAALAAIRSISAQVKREHRTRSRTRHYSARLKYAEAVSRFTADGSEIWDQGFRDTVSIQMWEALLSAIVDRLKNGELQRDQAWSLFCLVAKENKFAVTWKRLLERAKHSTELLPYVLPLVESPEILAAPETTVQAGDLIREHFGVFTAEQRSRIENRIWAIPDRKIAKLYRSPVQQRNRLLNCIPEQYRSPRVTSALAEAHNEGARLENQPFFQMGTFAGGAYTDREWLRDQGADVTTHTNRELLALKDSLTAFNAKYLNDVPPVQEIESLVPSLKSAYEYMLSATDADERVAASAFTEIASVAESIVKNGQLRPDGDALTLCRTIVVHAASYAYPQTDDNEEDFDFPGWSPTPKIEAAQAVMHWAANWGLDAEMADVMASLSTDKSPAVRFQVASALGVVYKGHRELFWKIATNLSVSERTNAVSTALVKAVGQAYIARQEPKALASWLSKLARRQIKPGKSRNDVIASIIDSLLYLYIYLNEPAADRLLRAFEDKPERHVHQLGATITSASYYLDYNIDKEEPLTDAVRLRAHEVELRSLRAVDALFLRMEERGRTRTKSEANKRSETIKELLMAIDHLVLRLHLMIGVDKNLAAATSETRLSQIAMARFFQESLELLRALVSVQSKYKRPMVASTAHHLMQMFNCMLPFGASQVLTVVWSLLTGQTLGYQFDALSITEFGKFAERILADYRQLLLDDAKAREFAEILDVFVRVGWPAATRIVLRMDEALK